MMRDKVGGHKVKMFQDWHLFQEMSFLAPKQGLCGSDLAQNRPAILRFTLASIL